MNNRLYLRFPDFKDKAVTLSYDDGREEDKRLLEIMKKYGLKGTFNLNSGRLAPVEDKKLTKEEVSVLYKEYGQEVAVHGVEHLPLADLCSTAAVNEISEDKKALENLTKMRIHGMAYAFGSYSDEKVYILKNCGIHYARTTVSTESFAIPCDWLKLPATCHHNNPKLLQLVDAFLRSDDSGRWWENRPKLFYLWGHSYEFANNDNWCVIEEFGKKIGLKKDIWYATNGEIYDYVTAYDNLEFSTNGDYVYNPSAIDVYVNFYGQEYVIYSGQRIEIKTSRL